MTGPVIGVMGHVDHGKTALVKALTGMDTDRLPEEKQRGLSIALGFAHLQANDGTAIDLIDMPGHERFVRTLLAGATGIDSVLLVVAADDGVMPQTVEHATIAGLLGVRNAVIAVTKSDLVGADEAEAVGREAAELLTGCGLETSAPIVVSAKTGTGIDELRGNLSRVVRQGAPPEGGIAFLPIDRAFTIAGHGTVVTGTLRGAPIRPGGLLELFPAGREVRVRTVQTRGVQRDVASPGQRVALNLRDVTADQTGRGAVLAAPGTLARSDWLTLAITAPERGMTLGNGQSLLALIGTDQIEIRLRLLDRDLLEPGENGFAQLHCSRPVAFPAGEPVILRIAAPSRTVAGGRILEPLICRRSRHRRHVLDRLRTLRDLPPDRRIVSELDAEAAAGVTIEQLARVCAVTQDGMVKMLRDLPVATARGGRVFRQCDLERCLAQIPVLLAATATGLSRNQLLSALAGTRSALLDEALSRLLTGKTVAKQGGQFAIPQPDRHREIERTEAALDAQLGEMFRLGGLTPPQPAAVVADAQNRRAVERLLRGGTIIRAIDRAKGREMLFHRTAIEEAKQRLSPLLREGEGLLVTEIGAALGISRKFVMPLLAHLDLLRFTHRQGDRRVSCPVYPIGTMNSPGESHEDGKIREMQNGGPM